MSKDKTALSESLFTAFGVEKPDTNIDVAIDSPISFGGGGGGGRDRGRSHGCSYGYCGSRTGCGDRRPHVGRND